MIDSLMMFMKDASYKSMIDGLKYGNSTEELIKGDGCAPREVY
jgi:hypothetical protein